MVVERGGERVQGPRNAPALSDPPLQFPFPISPIPLPHNPPSQEQAAQAEAAGAQPKPKVEPGPEAVALIHRGMAIRDQEAASGLRRTGACVLAIQGGVQMELLVAQVRSPLVCRVSSTVRHNTCGHCTPGQGHLLCAGCVHHACVQGRKFQQWAMVLQL